MARSVAIIGAGQIGFAAAGAFRSEGWDVTLYARTRPQWLWRGAKFQQYTLGEAPAPSADAVVDTIAFDEQDAARYDPDKVGHFVAISSASVYCDDQGRTLDEAAQNGFPEFSGPITEEQSTVAPGSETYSTRKIRMENKAQELFGRRATILRPCAVYGPHSRHPRELWFVKRLMDGRRQIPLAFGGESQFHTTSAQSMAELIAGLAQNQQGGVFNIADDNAPEVSLIGWHIADELGIKCKMVPFDGPPKVGVGRTPWSVPRPFVLDCKKAHDLGWDGFIPYPGVDDAAGWLRALNPADWRTAFPQLAAYPWDLFDYAAEDRFLASL